MHKYTTKFLAFQILATLPYPLDVVVFLFFGATLDTSSLSKENSSISLVYLDAQGCHFVTPLCMTFAYSFASSMSDQIAHY